MSIRNRVKTPAGVRIGIALLVLLSAILPHALVVTPLTQALSATVVISQVYGGGGNSGATFTHDFIELFNRGNTPTSLAGLSVQYASATGTTWQLTPLSGSLAPGQYYLIQEAQGAGGTISLPAPDATGTIAMSATAGKVALVNGVTALSGPCPSGLPVIDFVGYGAANCSELNPTAALTNTTAAIRLSGGCTETDSNSTDFVIGAPEPHNTASPLGACGAPTNPTGVGAANPSSVLAGGSTLLTVAVTPGANPTSTGITVIADLTSIGGSATQALLDAGTTGDAAPGFNVFSFQATVSNSTSAGPKTFPVTIGDAQARTGSSSIALTVQAPSAAGAIVISQIYGGGGNSGSVLKNDYIELFNRGATTVNVTGWTVQYTSAAGTTWQSTALSGAIGPGQYYLIQEAAGTVGSVNLPAPDAIGNIPMSATAGKVALVGNSSLLSGSGCPIGAGVLDFVGYGSTANCFEGSSPTSNLSNTTAAFRRVGGCTETDNNGADFFTGTANPRNSAAPPNTCGAGTPPLTLAIHEIQGSGTASSFSGQLVTTTLSIVTGLKSNGFFIQTPDGNQDSDPNTSEGVFVFTGGPAPAAALLGNAVTVTGIVTEFVPTSDPFSPPLTEISGSPTVTLVSSGNVLPAPITLTSSDTNPGGSLEQLEKYEAMRVAVASLTVVAPTQGSVNEPSARSSTNGVFLGVITGVPRPFREPGIETPNPLPPGSPLGVPFFDANPERVRVDSDGQPGAAALEVTAGAVLSNIVGPLDYSARAYTILPDPATPPIASGNASATPVPTPDPDEFTIASMNLQRFFDAVNDPAMGEPVLTTAAFGERLNKASLMIRSVARAPDIIGLEEIENLSTLQTLADKINADAIAGGNPNPNYAAFLFEGNDPGGIDVGFLIKTSRVTVLEATQEGLAATYINPNDGQPDVLNDRPPVVLRATLNPPGDPAFAVTVIVNHLRSLTDIDDPADGNRVRTKRRAQAEFLANLVQSRQMANPTEKIILVGDFNAFQFNDGYVDTIGTIKGTPTAANMVVLASGDLVNPNLSNLIDALPPSERYSYSFSGNAQVLDHILVNDAALPRVSRFFYARNNADFPDSFRNDPTRPERISDHDVPVAYFSLDVTAPLTTATTSPPVNANGWFIADVTVTLKAADTAGGSGVKEIQYTLTGAATGAGTVPGDVASIVIASEGTTTLRFFARDHAGNVEGTQTLVISLDKTSPAVTCPASRTVEATSSAGAVVNYPAATATDAQSTPVIVYSKPSGAQFPIGTTTVTVTATNAAGLSATCTFTVTVLGPRGPQAVLQNVLQGLVTLRAGVTDKQDANKLDHAIQDLTRALSPEFWVDPEHLDPRHGDRVFAELKDAVNQLQHLLKDKKSDLPEDLLHGFINRITVTARHLAAVAIDDAVAAGGDPKDIAKAREELSDGDAAAAAADRPDNAIGNYRNAWEKAMKAVKKL